MSFHLFLASAALFTLSHVPKSDHSHIHFIHNFIGQHFLFPPPKRLESLPSTRVEGRPSSICKCDKPLEPPSTCPAYFNFLFIMSFVNCNSVCNSICTRFMTSGVDTLSLQL